MTHGRGAPDNRTTVQTAATGGGDGGDGGEACHRGGGRGGGGSVVGKTAPSETKIRESTKTKIKT